jgi:3-phenylpropionate/cinnamic acid dioxygenase small subunit
VTSWDDTDPEEQMSIIYDNRSRISQRVKQLLTGRRHTQACQSRLRLMVSNIELLGAREGDISVGTNCLVVESNHRDDTIWAARSEYRLRKEGLDFRMAYKKVMLVDNHKPTFTLSFLI